MTKDVYATDNVTSLGEEREFALKFDVADVDVVLSLLVRAIQEAGYEDQCTLELTQQRVNFMLTKYWSQITRLFSSDNSAHLTGRYLLLSNLEICRLR